MAGMKSVPNSVGDVFIATALRIRAAALQALGQSFSSESVEAASTVIREGVLEIGTAVRKWRLRVPDDGIVREFSHEMRSPFLQLAVNLEIAKVELKANGWVVLSGESLRSTAERMQSELEEIGKFAKEWNIKIRFDEIRP